MGRGNETKSRGFGQAVEGRHLGPPTQTYRELLTHDIMVKGKLALAAAVTAASLSVFTAASQAVVYVEGTSDAGQALASSRDTTGTANVTGFSGTISFAQDADLYKFTVPTAGSYTFSDVNATTNTTAGGSLDTAIFLFDSTGAALYTNDDAAGGLDVTSSLTANLMAGTYYFGISLSGNEPVNSANQLLFAGYPNGDTTATRGTASGLNPRTEATFDSNSYTSDIGTYNVVDHFRRARAFDLGRGRCFHRRAGLPAPSPGRLIRCRRRLIFLTGRCFCEQRPVCFPVRRRQCLTRKPAAPTGARRSCPGSAASPRPA